MYNVNDFRVNELVVFNATGEKGIVIDINVASAVIYVRCLDSGVICDVLDASLIAKLN